LALSLDEGTVMRTSLHKGALCKHLALFTEEHFLTDWHEEPLGIYNEFRSVLASFLALALLPLGGRLLCPL